jgi:hypothetical protein
MFDCSLRFLAGIRSLVQDIGVPAWLSAATRDFPESMARSARCVSRLVAALFVVARGRESVSAPSSSPRRRAKRALAAVTWHSHPLVC